MKLKKLIVVFTISAFIFTGSVFATQSDPGPSNMTAQQIREKQAAELQMDPIKALQDFKVNIQSRYTDGKISKEKMEKMTAKIDAVVKEIEAFNKLSTKEKKEKLINGFTENTNKRIEQGKITKKKAEKAVSEFKAKIEKWDGNGYPPLNMGDLKRFGFDKGNSTHHHTKQKVEIKS